MYKVKKFLSAFLCVVVAATVFSGVTVFAATQEGTCGTNVKWSFNTVTGVLTISGRGEMTDLSGNSEPWSNIRHDIKSIIVEDGVTSIGDFAFGRNTRDNYYLYINLTSVTLPEKMTKIGECAFYGCCSLNEIDLPKNLTEIGERAFYGCSSLKTANAHDKITSIGSYAFSKCTLLGSFHLSEKLTSIPKGLFSGCTNLKTVDIPTGVTSIEREAFCNCSFLENVNIPSETTSIDSFAFSGCSSIETISIPKSVTYIGSDAFSDCSNLSKIYYDAENANKSTLYSSFANSDNVSDIVIRSNTNVIPSNLFSGLSGLYTLTIGSNVKEINENAFNGCNGIEDIYYIGTAGDWEQVAIEPGNECLSNAKMHYVSNHNVTYNANGGTQAPASQVKEYNVPLTLTDEIPVRDGFSFAGWAKSRTAKRAEYAPGDIYEDEAELTLYAVWNAIANVTIENVAGRPGNIVTVPISITNNPGIATFNLQINYDKAELKPVSIEMGEALTAGTLTSNLQQGGDLSRFDFVSAYWNNPSDITNDGIILNVAFQINENALEGDIPITITFNKGDAANQNLEDIELNIINGGITVKTIIMGDVDSDGAVNSRDGLKLSQYLAKWDIDMTPTELAAADVEADGKIDSKDGLKLSQYLAKWDVSIESIANNDVGLLAANGGKILFEVGSVTGPAGGFVDVPVTITSNSGIATFNMELNYDNAVLTPVSITKGAAIMDGSLTSNIQQGGDLSRFDKITAYWVNPSNSTSTGVAFTVRFSINSTASGDIPISLTYNKNDPPLDQSFNSLDVNITNGRLTVSGSAESYDYTVNSLTVEAIGTSARVKANVTKNSSRADEDAIIIAVYKNNALVDMIFMEAEFAQGQTVNFGGTLPVIQGAVYKAFVWDSLDNMQSLSNSLEK